MVTVKMYTCYADLHPIIYKGNLDEAIILQKERNQELYHIIHVENNIPLFPMSFIEFLKYKGLFELISKNNTVNFLFEYNNLCMCLNNGEYKEYKNKSEAICAICNVSDIKTYIHLKPNIE